jgi:FkbH-like protein
MNFYDLKSNLKKDFSNLKKVKVALLGDSATQLLVQAIKGYGYDVGINFEIYEADYDQIEMQVLDMESELYAFNPEYVIIYHSVEKLLTQFYILNNNGKPLFADKHIESFSNLYQTVTNKIKCKVIYFNFVETDDTVFGNYANKTDYSFLYQVRKINYELMNLSQKHKNLFINDIASLHNNYGAVFCSDPKIYFTTDLIFSLDFLPIVAKNLTDIIRALTGAINKCIILDLDNTIWGGIIGDDGLENIQIGELGIGKSFTALQMWLKQLKQRGIILAVCSKNDENIAKEPFEKHPDMILRLDDFAVFVANWNNKAENIKYIQSILNIGFDSIVFLDDNPFERNLVRSLIPGINVPELPEDPAEYISFLRSCNLFETASFTSQDEHRTKQYRQEAERAVVQKQYISEDEFLKNLNMTSQVKSFDKFNIPRVSQLTQRSNQFNLRTVRYTEEEISTIARSNDHIGLSFTLEDKYGDYGLISVVILKKDTNSLFIDTWIMSCRVLKRGMEKFVLNKVVEHARILGLKEIVGEYIPTPKNALVKDHYSGLGFTKCNNESNMWCLNIEAYIAHPTLIKEKLSTAD